MDLESDLELERFYPLEEIHSQEQGGLELRQDNGSQFDSRHFRIEPQSPGPVDASNFFLILPDELFLRILSFLPEVDLGRTAQVCRRWREMSFDGALWHEKSERWHVLAGIAPPRPLLRDADQRYYVLRYLSFRRHVREQAVENEQQRRMQAMQVSRERRLLRTHYAEDCLHFTMFNRVTDYVIFFATVLGTVFISLRLEGTITWPWGAVLCPFALIALYLLCPPISYDSTNLMFGPLDPSLRGGRQVQRWALCLLWPMVRVFKLAMYTLLLCIVAWLVLLWVKLQSPSTDIPWWGVFIPFFAGCLTLIQAPLVGDPTAPIPSILSVSRKLDRLFMALPPLMALVSALLIMLKLQEVISWQWVYVFVPLWVSFAMCIIVPAIFCCNCCCRESMSRQTMMASDGSSTCYFFIVFWFVLFGPVLTFIILLLQNIDGYENRKWPLVFIPIFILECFICSSCIAYDVMMRHHG